MAHTDSNTIRVALAGNPNSGKTTVFNALTGARHHVANYPGVTVEKKEGTITVGDMHVTIVDLPGTYSLSAYSVEERVARDYLFSEKPDVVVDVLDASNLERHLYLAVQLMEMHVPLILAFNMSDIARSSGLEFDYKQLEILLGARIVPMVASRGEGMQELMQAVIETFGQKAWAGVSVRYGGEVDAELDNIVKVLLEQKEQLPKSYPVRWLALKLLEEDPEICQLLNIPRIIEQAVLSRMHLRKVFGDSPDILVADRRYGFISGACQEAVKHTFHLRHDFSDLADKLLMHRYLGLPIFAAMMFLVFYLTFAAAAWPMRGLEFLFAKLGCAVAQAWPEHWLLPLKSLIVDGVVSGVGGVVIFLPNILLLFLSIAILEDTGYMARAAFLMDRIMHKIGLHGKSFIPMLIGFGCSVPAIMATRILENRRNRLATIMVMPLISCGARITIYALLIPAFFAPALRGPMMFLIYIIGIVLAIICIKLLRLTVFKGETIPFVMELPPYRLPTLKGLSIHMWQRAWMYLQKAGTVILMLSIILWALISYPVLPDNEQMALTDAQRQSAALQYSVAGRIGRAMEPLIKPLGFDWKIGTALIGAGAAKEVFVSQLSIVYAVGGESDENLQVLREKLRQDYSPLQGFCIMLFCLITAPCLATVVITRRESGAWKWALLQYGGLTLMAYVITLLVYQAGRLLL
ncbi:MAG: ferrous iron transport protein B [Planctomycetaceae bacterium]|nr:ferrous iron transport protein B [Planctomycetaceae bacterium]